MKPVERTVRIAGVAFGLRLGCPVFQRELERILEPFPSRPGASPGRQHYEVEHNGDYVLRKGRRVLFRCRDLDDALEYLEADLYGQLIRLLEGRLLFHAGGVLRHGTLILLPAPPRSGKTTLVAGLVKRGCRYVTDELLILEPRALRVRPLPKPLNLKHGSLPLFPRLAPQLRPTRPGPLKRPRQRIHHLLVHPRYRARGWIAPRRVVVLFPAYRARATACLKALHRAEAVRRLAAASYNHFRFGTSFLPLLERLTRGALCAELTYGDLQQALALIDHQVVALRPAVRFPASRA